MEIRLLGPVGLWSDGNMIDSGPARERCVLAILAMTPRTLVPAGVLVDRLWGPDPPAKAREDLSSYVTRIRKRLQKVTDGQPALSGHDGGYVLDVAAEATDLSQFHILARQARVIAESGDIEQAVALLREAGALFRGEALAGLPGQWFAGMRQSLMEERHAVILQRVELELELGRHAGLLGELRQLVVEFAHDERVTAACMVALYRSGRATEAGALYRQAHASLTEQGMEPCAELAALHQAILRRDAELAITPVHRRPPGTGQPQNLPPSPPDLVGRDRELRQLTESPENPGTPSAWIIEGMPGAGKTALAVHAARAAAEAYPDAQIYLALRGHDPDRGPLGPAAALDQLLRALGVPVGRIPSSLAQRAALWQRELASRRAVLLLDDASGAEQVRPLLPARGSCLTLITTRRRLHGLSPASVMSLGVLASPDAVSLFTRAAGEMQAGGEDLIAEAVGLCGYLPLAIQLAASKLKDGEPATLGELVDMLTRSPSAPAVSGVIESGISPAFSMSYMTLTHQQQRLFRLLAIHPCAEATQAAAAALTGATLADVGAGLDALADGYLIERRAGGGYGFHDLVRGYALARTLAEDTDSDRRRAAGRVLDYYLSATDCADRFLYPHRRRRPVQPRSKPALETAAQAQAWFEAEWPSLVQAIEYASAHEWQSQCTDLTHAATGFLQSDGHWAEAMTVHHLSLQAARALGDPGRIAQAELELARVSQEVGDYDQALTYAEHAAATYRALRDQRGEAETLDQTGITLGCRGRFVESLGYHEEAGSLYREAQDLPGLADTLDHSGISYASIGHYDQAIKHCTQALVICRQIGDRLGEARALNNLGELERRRGYHRDAVARFHESAQIYKENINKRNETLLHHNLGIVYQYRGRTGEALASYRRALGTYRSLGDRPDEANVLNDIGAVYESEAQHVEALAHFQNAERIADEIDDQYDKALAFKGMGDAYSGLGNYAKATSHYGDARRIAREISDPYLEAKIIAGLSEVVLHTQGPEAARIHLRQALAFFDQLNVPEAEQARARLYALATWAS